MTRNFDEKLFPDYISYELFPTYIIRSRCPSITIEDKKEMMESIDSLIADGAWTDNENSPKYQTYGILFQDKAPPIWKKLRDSFYIACESYLNKVDNFCGGQDTLNFSGFNAWGYKSWYSADLEAETNQPWHNHNPAFLAGVYYLHDPAVEDRTISEEGNFQIIKNGKKLTGETGGTEFHDPRIPPGFSTRMQEIAPIENTWIIFPGWLSHRSRQLPLEEPRYTVAANAWVIE